MAKTVFWALPAPLRERLHGVRHHLVRYLRTRRASTSTSNESDMSWTDFRNTILDKLDSSALTIVLEPTVDWNITLFQRPQHLAMALGRRGCIVLYRTTGDGVAGVREIATNVWLVATPEIDELKGAIWCFYSTASMSTPEQLKQRRRHGCVVYEYIDHIDSAISGGKGEIRRLLALKKTAVSGGADYLVASSRVLYDELVESGSSVPVCYIPNGVDVGHFRDTRHANVNLSADFQDFRLRYRKLVGYFGAIAPWLWFDMMEQLAKLRPDIGFVYIGPDYSGCVNKLPKGKNVLYTGAVPYEILPAYVKKFDAGFIPFQPGEIAQTTSPLKLYEFFSLEKPVVVTADMKECVAFDEVFSGYDSSTLSDAFDEALLAVALPAYRESVLGLAYDSTWDLRAEAYVRLLTNGQVGASHVDVD